MDDGGKWHQTTERGASAIEYCVMVLLIALGLVGVLGLVGAAINAMMLLVADAF